MNAPRRLPPGARPGAAPVPGGGGRESGRSGRRQQRSARGPSNSEPRAGQRALGEPPPCAHAGGGGGGSELCGGSGRPALPLENALTGGGEDTDRLSAHSRGRAGWRRAGGAPATVTGTNKEVLCARAAARPAPPQPPAPRPRRPPPPRLRLRTAPAPAPAPPPGPRSDAGVRVGAARLAGLRKLASWRRPRSGYFSELVTPAFCEKRDQKKLCAFFFSPEWVQEARPGEPPPAAKAAGRAKGARAQGRPRGPECGAAWASPPPPPACSRALAWLPPSVPVQGAHRPWKASSVQFA